MKYDEITIKKLSELVSEARNLLVQYRYSTRGQKDTVFIGQIEIVLALTDFLIHENRILTSDEREWFSKNFLLHYAFDGTEYDRMIKAYDEICLIVNSIYRPR